MSRARPVKVRIRRVGDRYWVVTTRRVESHATFDDAWEAR